MKNLWKVIIVFILASSVVAVVILKNKENPQPTIVEPNQAGQSQKLPTLIDLGADKCIPCKMMIPVIEELTKEYAGKLQVEFYDVWKDPAPGQKFGIRVIPTQIFLDPNGKELYRHEGYFSKEDILAKWKEFGFELKKKD